MKRRSFVARLLGSIVAAPVAARALEAEATPRRFVGIDHNREPSRTVATVMHVHDSIEVEGGTAARSLSFEGGEVVEFSDAATTAQEIARQINEQAVGVVASLDGDSVVLRPW
jgi:hypothetical protein